MNGDGPKVLLWGHFLSRSFRQKFLSTSLKKTALVVLNFVKTETKEIKGAQLVNDKKTSTPSITGTRCVPSPFIPPPPLIPPHTQGRLHQSETITQFRCLSHTYFDRFKIGASLPDTNVCINIESHRKTGVSFSFEWFSASQPTNMLNGSSDSRLWGSLMIPHLYNLVSQSIEVSNVHMFICTVSEWWWWVEEFLS